MNANGLEEFNETTNSDTISLAEASKPAIQVQRTSQRPARKFFPLMIPTTTDRSGEYIPIHIAIQRFLQSPVNRNPSYYEVPMLGTLPTVRHAYAEWYFGINGSPAIISCVKKYGK